MKRADLKFSTRLGYPDFTKQCVLNDSQYGFAEICKIIRAAKNTEDFAAKFLSDKRFIKNQSYQEVVKRCGNPWMFVREMFGDNCKKTFSSAGSLKVGNEAFSILLPNGRGDGCTRYAILEEKDFYANSIMKFFTSINGGFDIYSYDCGNEVVEHIEGCFFIYYYDGFIALVKSEE